MFSHIFVSVSDFERALRFYGAVMDSLGIEQRFCDRERPWAGWHSAGGARPLFVICKPFDGQPHHAGNGQMVSFAATSRAKVRAAYQTALENGGTCEGPQGYARSTTTTTTAPTFATRTGTSCALPVMPRRLKASKVGAQ